MSGFMINRAMKYSVSFPAAVPKQSQTTGGEKKKKDVYVLAMWLI